MLHKMLADTYGKFGQLIVKEAQKVAGRDYKLTANRIKGDFLKVGGLGEFILTHSIFDRCFIQVVLGVDFKLNQLVFESYVFTKGKKLSTGSNMSI